VKYLNFLDELNLIDTQAKKDLAAVKKNGYDLKYVQYQTPKICLAAVKQNGFALYYVEKQTPELCLAAIMQNSDALRYVKKNILKKNST